jgi:hypothetical protein
LVTMLVALAACAAPIDLATPTLEPALPAPTMAPLPTPVGEPTAVSTNLVVGAGEAPQLTCGGGVISGADIDYVGGAPGVTDILAATRAFLGVRATDVIVVEPTVTVVVRDGQPVWRGEWYDGGNGFLLGSKTACENAGIR